MRDLGRVWSSWTNLVPAGWGPRARPPPDCRGAAVIHKPLLPTALGLEEDLAARRTVLCPVRVRECIGKGEKWVNPGDSGLNIYYKLF